jgi:glycosyltransferase involved in cell wall biosynthesis
MPPLPPSRPNGSAWPRVSVVTPSLNQAEFLEETIRSVLLQGYPDLEYVIADGGSHDGSVTIIERYAAHLAHWWSAPDRGQSQAINAGFTRCTGSVWAWLNSDDVYLPGTLRRIGEIVGGGSRLVYGSSQFIDTASRPLGPYPGKALPRGWRRMRYWKGWPVPQPTLFFDARLFAETGPLDESVHYALDYEWVLRASSIAEATCLPETLALYRVHPSSKTGDDWESRKPVFFAEMERINRRHAPPWRPQAWALWLSWAAYRAATGLRRLLRPKAAS